MSRGQARSLWLGSLIALAACGGGRNQAATPGAATAPARGDAALDAAEPLDARVTRGTLDNGLTYYVMPNRHPEKRAQLWLAVNAGSVLEDDDQQGLAHFVEHMAFNGTARFPGMEIVNFLERIGMNFGADLNAYTSFDETVYMLTVPTDDAALIGKGLDVLRDWAGGLAFDPAELDKERGVVTEEWRLGRGADMRVLDKQYPILFHGARYGSRLPIGKPEILKSAPRDALTRFYRDWYRPDLMAIVAVGDFDAATLEREIKARFADLAGPPSPRPRPTNPVPSHPETLVDVATDAELTQTTVELHHKMRHRPERTARDYRGFIADQLFHAMLGARLDELRQRPSAPFVWAWSSSDDLAREADDFALTAIAKEGQAGAALDALYQEYSRVARHGFTAGELDRARQDLRRGYQQLVAELDKQESTDLASELVRNFLEDELVPGRVRELAMVEQFLPTITLDELHAMARAWGGGEGRVVLVKGPATLKAPSPDQLVAILHAVDQREVAAYDDGAARPLMTARPSPGQVVDEKAVAAVGVTEWTLANGVRVVLKPTTFKHDEISLEGFSPGGTSVLSDADFDAGRFADDILAEGGAGQLDAVALRKALAGKLAGARLWLGELEEGVSASSSVRDLETMLQLVHLEMTAPRRDETAFATWKARELEASRNRRLDPDTAFHEDMQSLLSQDHRRYRPITPEALERADLDRALAVHADRFGDASDFTFVLVGNLDLAAVRPLVETYLGSLPGKARKERWKDVGVRRPRGKHKKLVRQGHEPKSSVYLVFHGDEPWSRDAANDMKMLGEVLDIRLREVLREDLGGVYGASSFGWLSRRPRQWNGFFVGFGCAPENVDKLTRAVFDEAAKLARGGIGDDYLGKIKESRRRSHETELKENGYWAGELAEAYRHGDDPARIDDVAEMIEKVSSARVKAAARRYLAPTRYVLGVLEPASATPATAATPAAAAAR